MNGFGIDPDKLTPCECVCIGALVLLAQAFVLALLWVSR